MDRHRLHLDDEISSHAEHRLLMDVRFDTFLDDPELALLSIGHCSRRSSIQI